MKSNVIALRQPEPAEATECGAQSNAQIERGTAPEIELAIDGERITVVADRELVLRCGQASLTLTRAGKIILKGTHVVSCSTGVNKLQGTQIRIN